MDWRTEITDEDEIKVFAALDGPDVTWRTVSGVARHAGLSDERVAQICAKYNLRMTRVSDVSVRLWIAIRWIDRERRSVKRLFHLLIGRI